jgi:hypothetical protein
LRRNLAATSRVHDDFLAIWQACGPAATGCRSHSGFFLTATRGGAGSSLRLRSGLQSTQRRDRTSGDLATMGFGVPFCAACVLRLLFLCPQGVAPWPVLKALWKTQPYDEELEKSFGQGDSLR